MVTNTKKYTDRDLASMPATTEQLAEFERLRGALGDAFSAFQMKELLFTLRSSIQFREEADDRRFQQLQSEKEGRGYGVIL